IVEFSIVARSGDVEAPVNRFVQYLERDLVLSEDVNPDRTVVVRVNADGTLTVVPTIVRDGRVTFKSFTNSYYVAVEREASFTDLRDDYWAKEQIEKLAVRDIFQGRQDGTVAPGEPVTRVQLAVLITRALALVSDVEYDGRFVDVQGDEWFMGEFMAAIEAGIVLGRQDGTFSPNEPVNRQQAAAMISRAMEHIGYNEADLDTTKSITQYPDAERIGEWAEADVERLLQAGIMEGRNTGLFDPTDETTRAQMAAMLERFLIFSDLMNE
ncbi:S-layer homology domain-containing protein, partial [Halalkalibacterium ligniniphilum]|uniref:S-layer homology domain-containing protein n=1 Tax=Halalkalibacterium ligniniphilum TaxID=1134413 RepID=UPI00054DDC90